MQNLVFPSGLSVQRAKKRAKELVKSKQKTKMMHLMQFL
ncbi:hypothetical protein AbD4_03951 [Acinetobacter baumannii]|nr:hypothetical protein A1S_3819 [Acinetobacter baumannii ATCC 17978]EJG22030.1 hypothetical protein ACIN5143_A3063 [Acinetobacter baumannii OIFC143]EJP51427.1 hypothetical protein ACINNAV18_0043 [Acinetobacter baumannii Naval-18]ETR80829.1 hypothetical protein M214_4042 [Acinetobacter baumannii CI86]ETR82249.1 hypothetical protein M212_4064 [Acinetobacter baumannii CI79]EXE68231.1 hypothetical protein J585_1858 [Acinetobacter baumannii 397971]QUX89661.1 hypothetical protein AbD4_03951 [Acine